MHVKPMKGIFALPNIILAVGPNSNDVSKANVTETMYHSRRIYLEDKAKVVATDWWTKSLPR